MTENPYRLARDIRGIRFKTADAIAMKLGIEKAALVRVARGDMVLADRGHGWGVPRLADGRADTACREAARGPAELIRAALDLELQGGTVVADRVGETPTCFWQACIGRSAPLPRGG